MDMKKVMLTAITALMLCSVAFAQDKDTNKKKVEGSGNIITKEVNVQSFDEISASGVYSLVFIQGSKEGVKIEADDNLQELFEVTNEGSKLKIAMKKDINFNSEAKLKVYVTFNKLKAMNLKMVGSTRNEGQLSFDNLAINSKGVGNVELKLSVKKLDVDNKGVGDLRLSGKAEDVTIHNKGVGSVDAADFVVQKMNIENTGVGHAEVNAEKELTVKESFLGKVRNKGAAAMKKTGKTSS